MFNVAFRRSLYWAPLLLCLAACSEREVNVPRLKPAALHFPDTHTVAVGTISGEGGEDLGDLITHSLQNTKHFAILERSAVLDILREQHFNAMDPLNVQHVGRLLGADTLVFGRVLQNGVDAQVTRRHISTEECESLRFMRRGEYHLRVLLRAVDTRTGLVIGSRDLAVNESLTPSVIDIDDIRDWDGREPKFKPIDAYGIQLDGYTRLADRFAKDVTPHWVWETVTMYEDKRIPMSKSAITAAQLGDWKTAVEVYRMGVAQADADPGIPAKYRARAHYNLGVGLAFSGHFDEGIQKLQDASSIWGCEVFAKTLDRARRFKADSDAAKRQIKEVTCRANKRNEGWCPAP